MSVLGMALEPSTLVVAVDPGKVMNRVWVTDGSGSRVEPASVAVSRDGIVAVERVVAAHGRGRAGLVFAIEATGSLHRPWASFRAGSQACVWAGGGDAGCLRARRWRRDEVGR